MSIIQKNVAALILPIFLLNSTLACFPLAAYASPKTKAQYHHTDDAQSQIEQAKTYGEKADLLVQMGEMWKQWCISADGHIKSSEVQDESGELINCVDQGRKLEQANQKLASEVAANNIQTFGACSTTPERYSEVATNLHSIDVASQAAYDENTCSKAKRINPLSCKDQVACNFAAPIEQALVKIPVIGSKIRASMSQDSCLSPKNKQLAGDGNCYEKFARGVVNGLWGPIHQTGQMIWSALSWAGNGIKNGANTVLNGIKSWFGAGQTVGKGVNTLSQRSTATSHQSPSAIKEFFSNPAAFIGNMIKSIYTTTLNAAMKEYGGGGAFECMSCNEQTNMVCGVMGLVGGNAALAFLTGGAASLANDVGLTAKIMSGLSKTASFIKSTKIAKFGVRAFDKGITRNIEKIRGGAARAEEAERLAMVTRAIQGGTNAGASAAKATLATKMAKLHAIRSDIKGHLAKGLIDVASRVGKGIVKTAKVIGYLPGKVIAPYNLLMEKASKAGFSMFSAAARHKFSPIQAAALARDAEGLANSQDAASTALRELNDGKRNVRTFQDMEEVNQHEATIKKSLESDNKLIDALKTKVDKGKDMDEAEILASLNPKDRAAYAAASARIETSDRALMHADLIRYSNTYTSDALKIGEKARVEAQDLKAEMEKLTANSNDTDINAVKTKFAQIAQQRNREAVLYERRAEALKKEIEANPKVKPELDEEIKALNRQAAVARAHAKDLGVELKTTLARTGKGTETVAVDKGGQTAMDLNGVTAATDSQRTAVSGTTPKWSTIVQRDSATNETINKVAAMRKEQDQILNEYNKNLALIDKPTAAKGFARMDQIARATKRQEELKDSYRSINDRIDKVHADYEVKEKEFLETEVPSPAKLKRLEEDLAYSHERRTDFQNHLEEDHISVPGMERTSNMIRARIKEVDAEILALEADIQKTKKALGQPTTPTRVVDQELRDMQQSKPALDAEVANQEKLVASLGKPKWIQRGKYKAAEEAKAKLAALKAKQVHLDKSIEERTQANLEALSSQPGRELAGTQRIPGIKKTYPDGAMDVTLCDGNICTFQHLNKEDAAEMVEHFNKKDYNLQAFLCEETKVCVKAFGTDAKSLEDYQQLEGFIVKTMAEESLTWPKMKEILKKAEQVCLNPKGPKKL